MSITMASLYPPLVLPIQRIDADLLIPGRGDPITDGTVVWQQNEILYAGARSSLPDRFATIEPAFHVPVVMPGMWDCHIHYPGAADTSPWGLITTSQVLAGARSVPDLEATILAGFTSVREVGGYGGELAKAVAEGRIPGPTIYSAYNAISMTAGHGDFHQLDTSCLHDLCARGLPTTIADGVDACIRAVRLQLRRGGRVIKVCASGGVASGINDPHHQEYSLDELKAIVDEAARAQRIVAAHCHGKAGIMNALLAGCKTIEHGSYLDEECIDLMLEKGAMLVATRSVIEDGLSIRQLFSPDIYHKLELLADAHKHAYEMAVRRGVTIALGTDQFVGSNNPNMGFGRSGKELVYAVEAGMTPLQALTAATANGPSTLGPQAPPSGLLQAGYHADIIALSQNPIDDIQVIADGQNVTHVWQGGKSVKKNC